MVPSFPIKLGRQLIPPFSLESSVKNNSSQEQLQSVVQRILRVGSDRQSCTACSNVGNAQMREKRYKELCPLNQEAFSVCTPSTQHGQQGSKINMAISLLCSTETPEENRGWMTTARLTKKFLFWIARMCSQEVSQRILAESARLRSFPSGASIAMRPFFTPSSAGYGLIATIWPFICITKVYIHTQVSPYLL